MNKRRIIQKKKLTGCCKQQTYFVEDFAPYHACRSWDEPDVHDLISFEKSFWMGKNPIATLQLYAYPFEAFRWYKVGRIAWSSEGHTSSIVSAW